MSRGRRKGRTAAPQRRGLWLGPAARRAGGHAGWALSPPKAHPSERGRGDKPLSISEIALYEEEPHPSEITRLFRLAAAEGDRNAQYNLGLMYEIGRGVRRDRAEATRWYSLAAEQGDEDARKRLDDLR